MVIISINSDCELSMDEYKDINTLIRLSQPDTVIYVVKKENQKMKIEKSYNSSFNKYERKPDNKDKKYDNNQKYDSKKKYDNKQKYNKNVKPASITNDDKKNIEITVKNSNEMILSTESDNKVV